jgi:cleavage and polyadenylation specificity factor subunit 1
LLCTGLLTWYCRYQLDPAERVLCIKSLSIEVEDSREWKELIAVGTGVTRGEDISAKGCIYIFEVIDVVAELERPETGHKLKLLSKEEAKGIVSAISSIGTEGCLLVAQGQKCMVRGLKEDGNLLPVAFMDMQCYVSVAKELKGTGMCLMGDALKGLWLVGYTVRTAKLQLAVILTRPCRRNLTG